MGARDWQTIAPGSADLGLVVCDLDGTLLDAAGRLPEGFWDLVATLNARGGTFVPASGRQYATLAAMFEGHDATLAYIAENGNLVVRDGEVLSASSVDSPTVHRVIETVRAIADRDAGLVVCGRDGAYVERTDPAFIDQCATYYARLTPVADLAAVDDDVLKLAVFDADDAEACAAEYFSDLADSHQVVISGAHWVDVMIPGITKGYALAVLQDTLGVGPERTAVFGDYLNDLDMLAGADYSFAMANAHPVLIDRARYLAPSNEDDGVMRVLAHVLSPAGPARD